MNNHFLVLGICLVIIASCVGCVSTAQQGYIFSAEKAMARGKYSAALKDLANARSLGTPKPEMDAEMYCLSAECYEELNMQAEADGTYKFVATHFPNTVYGYIAKEKIDPGPFLLEVAQAGDFLKGLHDRGLLPGDFQDKGLKLESTVEPLPLPKEVVYPFSHTFFVVNPDKTLTNNYTVGRLSRDSEWQCQRIWRTDAKGDIVKEWPVYISRSAPKAALGPTATMPTISTNK